MSKITRAITIRKIVFHLIAFMILNVLVTSGVLLTMMLNIQFPVSVLVVDSIVYPTLTVAITVLGRYMYKEDVSSH